MSVNKYQHPPLRVPAGWTAQDRALVIQIERLLDDLYNKYGQVKQDENGFVDDVFYDGTNKKLKKTIGGTDSDIVSVSKLKTDMAFTKNDIGLGNVDNTSDTDKPVSTATQTALDGKANKATGATNGNFAALDANGNLTDSGHKHSDYGTVSSVDTGVGLTGGPVTGSGTIKAKLKSETLATYAAAEPTNTQDRQYPVVPDSNGNLSVNVPWTGSSHSGAYTWGELANQS